MDVLENIINSYLRKWFGPQRSLISAAPYETTSTLQFFYIRSWELIGTWTRKAMEYGDTDDSGVAAVCIEIPTGKKLRAIKEIQRAAHA